MKAGVCKIFSKRPDSKYFWPSGPYSLFQHSALHKSTHRQYVNKWIWVFYKKTLATKTGRKLDIV